MELVIDTHTHSISSGHAYSTVQELARGAADNGIKVFALTDHGPAMGGAPHLYHFGNLKEIPEVIYGVRIIKGVESNIIDYEGNIDIPAEYLGRLQFVLASFHDICIRPSDVSRHTKAMIGALRNPYVDAVAHPGNPRFQVDIEAVVSAAKEFGKLIEINNHSFSVRKGCDENCLVFAQKCKEKGVRIVSGSDAHISFDVGRLDRVKALFDEADIPEELVLNSSVARFEAYLAERNERVRRLIT